MNKMICYNSDKRLTKQINNILGRVMDKKSVTIRDIARIAKVSVATVSHVIARTKYVSPELTVRVNSAIKQLNYKPSSIARSLKVKKTFYIGVIVPDIKNPYFAEIARGIESVAVNKGYQIFLYNSDGDLNREEKAYNSFLRHKVDGIICVAPRIEEDVLKNFASIPFVVLDRPLETQHQLIGQVYTNNIESSAKVAQYFLEKGHKKFACIAGPKNHVPNVKKRVLGFSEEIKKSGVHEDSVKVYYGDFNFESGYNLMSNVIDMRERPTAVFVCSDIMAWGAIEAVKAKGIKIPEDIAVIGFDDVYFAAFITPALTTINQKKYEAGEIAMQVLLDKIDGNLTNKHLKNHKVILDFELVVRDSA